MFDKGEKLKMSHFQVFLPSVEFFYRHLLSNIYYATDLLSAFFILLKGAGKLRDMVFLKSMLFIFKNSSYSLENV